MSTKADHAVDTAAEKLGTFVDEGHRAGGVKAKVADALAEDPDFLRKLKPSLIAARAKGNVPDEDRPNAPSGPQLDRTKPKATKKRGGLNPFVVAAAALALGYGIAKVIDWRGHAHPRY
jgi:hypothetical protein